MSFARVRAIAIVGALLVCAIVLVTLAVTKDSQRGVAEAGKCPPGTVPVQVKPLPVPQDIKMRVYNAKGVAGVADNVADDFKNRGFSVLPGDTKDANGKKIADPYADPAGQKVDGVAVIRYGPKTLTAMWVVQAYFLAEAQPQFDIKNNSTTVDVIIGQGFQQLGTVTEVKQSISQLGEPQPPEGTCAVS